MILAQVLFFIFIVFLLLDYKKTVLIYTPLKLIFTTAFILFDYNVTAISFDFAANVLILFFFILKGYRQSVRLFPFYKSFTLSILSIAITFILTSKSSSFHYTLLSILSNYVYIYIFWVLLDTKKDVDLVIRFFVITFLFLCLYGIFTFLYEENPILNFIVDNTKTVQRLAVDTSLDIRFGFGRTQSIMFNAISFGAVCALFFGFLYNLNNSLNYLKIKGVYYNLFYILLFISIIISNSRSSIVCFLICLLQVITVKNIFSLRFLFLLLFCVLTYTLLGDFIISNLDSLINSSQNVNGSSLEMRLLQLDRTLKYFFQAPLFGNGVGYLGKIILLKEDVDLYGAESIWFSVLADFGLLGVLSYIFIYVDCFNYFKKTVKRYFLIIYMFAWLILNTMTSVPGVDFSFFLSLLIITHRLSVLKSIDKKSL